MSVTRPTDRTGSALFDDGLTKSVDLEDELWGPAFEPLRGPDSFGQVSVDEEPGTIAWPNGADFSSGSVCDHPASDGHNQAGSDKQTAQHKSR